MNAKQLAATRTFYGRRGESGFYRFVQNCLEGIFGDDAQSAASGVLADLTEQGYSPMVDRDVSRRILEAVESAEEGTDLADVRRGGTR